MVQTKAITKKQLDILRKKEARQELYCMFCGQLCVSCDKCGKTFSKNNMVECYFVPYRRHLCEECTEEHKKRLEHV